METNPDAPKPPTLQELRERVDRHETELKESLQQLGEIIEHAADWKRVVEEHPIECALGAATLGLLVGLRPSMLTDVGVAGVRGMMGFGLDSLFEGLGPRHR
jgi:hypothetical protein